MKALLYIPVALFLVACGTNPEKALAVSCQGYASTLNSLATAKAGGQLSEAQIATVDRYRPILNEICLNDNWADPVEARATVEDALWNLVIVQEEAR